MDCTAAGQRAAIGTALPTEATPPPASTTASGVLCMCCEVRPRCLGGIAAQAGTAQLKEVLAGRSSLGVRDTLYGAGEAFRQVYVVRRGTLKSTTRSDDGERVNGFHLPGELVGVDGMMGGRHRTTVTALEESELCALRFAPRPDQASGVRAVLARLWDMMSCELLRERAHQELLATLPPVQRVAAFLASVAGRAGRRRWPLPLAVEDVASYLRLAPEAVASVPAPPPPARP